MWMWTSTEVSRISEVEINSSEYRSSWPSDFGYPFMSNVCCWLILNKSIDTSVVASHTQFSSKHYFTSQNTFYFRNMVSKHCFKTLWEVFWRFSIVFWNSVLKQCFEILHMYFQNTIPKHYLKTLFQNTFSNYCFKLVLLINVWAGHRCLWKVIWNSVSKYNFEIVFWNSVLKLIWNSVLK